MNCRGSRQVILPKWMRYASRYSRYLVVCKVHKDWFRNQCAFESSGQIIRNLKKCFLCCDELWKLTETSQTSMEKVRYQPVWFTGGLITASLEMTRT